MQALKSEGGFVWACKNYGMHLPMLTGMAQHLRCSQHIFKGLLARRSCDWQAFFVAWIRDQS